MVVIGRRRRPRRRVSCSQMRNRISASLCPFMRPKCNATQSLALHAAPIGQYKSSPSKLEPTPPKPTSARVRSVGDLLSIFSAWAKPRVGVSRANPRPNGRTRLKARDFIWSVARFAARKPTGRSQIPMFASSGASAWRCSVRGPVVFVCRARSRSAINFCRPSALCNRDGAA